MASRLMPTAARRTSPMGAESHERSKHTVRRSIRRYSGVPVDAPVSPTTERLGAMPTQVILSWVHNQGVMVPIGSPGSV